MDQLPIFGTAISQIVQPTFKTFVPLLASNASAIKSTKSQTFQYGAHPRQYLDVYYPPSSSEVVAAAATTARTSGDPTSSSHSPILVFLYGGGLVRGDKILTAMPGGLIYANVGHFFAENYGYTVVLPDYRLLSHGAKFPSGGEDVALVVEWILKSDLVKEGESRELYMMGNSAGGIHLTTYLFTPKFQESRTSILGEGQTGLRLRNVVELSVPFHFGSADESRKEVLEEFYGGDMEQDCPFGLLKSVVDNGGVAKLLPHVKFLVLTGSLDPQDEILSPNEDFVGVWRTKGAPVEGELQVEVMEGQNHISPPLCLGTGRAAEEAWGHQVAQFFSSNVTL